MQPQHNHQPNHAFGLPKKCLCMTVSAATLITGLCGCGNGPADKLTTASVEATKGDYSAADFVVKDELTLRTVPTAEGETAKEVKVPEGTHVSVIETKVDASAGTIVRLGLDVDADSGIPSDAWVPLDSTLLSSLMKVDGVDDEVADSSTDQKEGTLLKAARAAKKKMTYCYAYVKQELLRTGRVSGFIAGGSAWMAANELPKWGFRRTGHSPAQAAVGEVCVYSGGPQGHGHIEIRKPGGWWYGYGVKSYSMPNRHFIACFNK